MGQTYQSTGTTAGTVEVPLTPGMYAIIRGDSAKAKRTLYIVAAGVFVFCLGLGVVEEMLAITAAIGVGVALILVACTAFVGRVMRKDLQEQNFLRSSGAFGVEESSSGDGDGGSTTTYRMRVGDRSFYIDPGVGAKLRRLSLSVATVDHTKHAHVIFEVKDEAGSTVYQHPSITRGSERGVTAGAHARSCGRSGRCGRGGHSGMSELDPDCPGGANGGWSDVVDHPQEVDASGGFLHGAVGGSLVPAG